jgi:hypothetical protein
MEGCGLLVLLIIGVIVTVAAVNGSARKKAHDAYVDGLLRLKNDPTNPDLRAETLALGRAYSDATRNWRGVTVFDEVALMNDINAACAAATRQPVSAKSNGSVEDRLAPLGELKSKGLIDQAEYAERRREILKDV